MAKDNKGKQGIKPKKKSKAGLIIVRIIAAILGLAVGVVLYGYKILGGFNFVSVPVVSEEEYDTLEVGENGSFTGGDVTSDWSDGGHTRVYVDPAHPIIKVDQIDKNVENILIFGIDSSGTDDVRARSDAMMIMSINKKENTVKLISLMRDIGVYIGDTDETASTSLDKLTHAYAYGGVGLMINTINRNFGLDIQRFVMLDFNSAADIVDLVGGVTIDVEPGEVDYANINITEQSNLLGIEPPLISSSGEQTLNGVQAIGWSRIRYLDSDFVRTSRQREVATALIQEVSDMSLTDQLAMIEDSAGIFETNMQQLDLARVGVNAVGGSKAMDEYRVPADGMYTVQQDPWMMILDWDTQLDELHEFIWGE